MVDKLTSTRDGSTIYLNNKKIRNVLNFQVGRSYLNSEIEKTGRTFSSNEYMRFKKMITLRKNLFPLK